MRKKSIFLTIVAVTGVSVAQGQVLPIPQAHKDAQALTILAQAQSQLGAAGSIQDSQAEGTITLPGGRTGSIVLKSKGASLRHETTVDGDTTVSVVANGRGRTTHQGKQRKLPDWVTAYQRSLHIPALSRIVDAVRANSNLTYLGLEDVGGSPAHRIKLTSLPSNPGDSPEVEAIISEFQVFLDAKTLLPVKTITYDFAPDIIENRSTVETYYSDFRVVQGIVVPFRITRMVNAQKQMEIVLNNIRFNVGLSDVDFQ